MKIMPCAAIFFFLYVLINRWEKIEKKKVWSVGALILCTLIAVVLNFVPVENLFVTFDSPHEAYSYSNKGNIVLVVEGEETTKVIAMKKDAFIHSIFPKTEKGWKLASPFSVKEIGTYTLDGIHINVTRYRDTDEYYLNIMSAEGKELALSDGRGTQFLSTKETADGYFRIYHAYVNAFDSEYTLIVNGKSICIAKDMEKVF